MQFLITKEVKNLRDIFPDPPNPKDIPGCDKNVVLATLPAIIGSMMAQETLKLIVNMNTSKNQLIIFNTQNWTFKKLNY